MRLLDRHLASIALTGLLLCAALPAHAASGRPPNVGLILADDHGYGDLSSYGQTRYTTPGIDRLAAEGVEATHYDPTESCDRAAADPEIVARLRRETGPFLATLPARDRSAPSEPKAPQR